MSHVSDLERRYARWMALFYPADYRRERGSELVGTYLSMAAPGRNRPSAADVADLAAGGIRQHLRLAGDLEPGFGLAGLLALMTTTAFAAAWTVFETFASKGPWILQVNPFLTIGIAAWVAWLGAALAYAVAPVRWFRRVTGAAILVTAGLLPATMLTGLPRPPMFVILPQLALGIVTLGAPAHQARWVRLLPFAVGVISASVMAAIGPVPGFFGNYYFIAARALPNAAALLLLVTTLLAVALVIRRESRGVWALLILLTPIGMLALDSLGALFDDSGPGRPAVPAWHAMLAASLLVAVLGPALLMMILSIRRRLLPA